MKYYWWLRTFKGVSKRIYGSPLNPVKNTSARGKVGARLHVKACVSRERRDERSHIVGFKFHFVKYFYPASRRGARRERMLQRRRAHPNKALRKLYVPRGANVCVTCIGTRVSVCTFSRFHFYFRRLANEKCQCTYSRVPRNFVRETFYSARLRFVDFILR